jgi:ABC-type branched-subunit amino acid transport system substrate-binding protein
MARDVPAPDPHAADTVIEAGPTRREGLRLLGLGAGVGALGLGLAGCSGGGVGNLPGFGTPPSPQSQVPAGPAPAGGVPVALLLPLGAGGQGAVVANALKNAAEMALAEFPEANVRLIVKDDRGSADGARAAAQEALAEGAELIIGPLFAPAVAAAGEVTRAAGRPMIAFSTDASVAGNGVYLLSFLPETEVVSLIAHAAQQGRRSYAALISQSTYGNVVEGPFRQAVSERGGRVIAIERFAQTQEAMEEAVRRLAVAFPQADALFVPEPVDFLGPIDLALKANGFAPGRIRTLGTGVWNDPRAFRLASFQGGWFAAPDANGFNAFAQRYQQRFAAAPTRIASLSYTALTLAAALVRTQGSQRFAPQVLANPSGFDGVDGLFRFRPNGLVERGLAILELRNGTSVTVRPAPREFASA